MCIFKISDVQSIFDQIVLRFKGINYLLNLFKKFNCIFNIEENIRNYDIKEILTELG